MCSQCITDFFHDKNKILKFTVRQTFLKVNSDWERSNKMEKIWGRIMVMNWSVKDGWLCFMVYQPLWVILCQILLISTQLAGGCRIHWLHLCRRVRPPPTSVLDMVLNNLIVRLQLWRFGECRSTPSLPLLPGLLSPDRVLPLGQIEQTMCAC